MNPLAQYKKDQGLSWRELTEKTGLCLAHLQKLSQAGPQDLLWVRLRTLRTIEDTTGVDLIAYSRQK